MSIARSCYLEMTKTHSGTFCIVLVTFPTRTLFLKKICLLNGKFNWTKRKNSSFTLSSDMHRTTSIGKSKLPVILNSHVDKKKKKKERWTTRSIDESHQPKQFGSIQANLLSSLNFLIKINIDLHIYIVTLRSPGKWENNKFSKCYTLRYDHGAIRCSNAMSEKQIF